MTKSISNAQPKLSLGKKVAFLDIQNKLPDNVIKVGNLRFKDNLLAVDCSFNSLLVKARTQARKVGANIVKIVDKKTPDLWSTCYRLKIELYKYSGDVSKLNQYQLSLD